MTQLSILYFSFLITLNKQSWDDDEKQSIRDVLEVLRKQLKSIDSQFAKLIQADTEPCLKKSNTPVLYSKRNFKKFFEITY